MDIPRDVNPAHADEAARPLPEGTHKSRGDFPGKRWLLNTFIICNMCAILWANASIDVRIALFQTSQKLYVLVNNYTYLTGLDGHWVMFVSMFRARTYYTVEASYKGRRGRELLHLPMQGERTFWERNLFDFRDQKYLLIISAGKFNPGRTAYAKYLCRQPSPEKIRSISFMSHTQVMQERAMAAATGSHLQPTVYDVVIEEIGC